MISGTDSVTVEATRQTWKKKLFAGLLMLACWNGTARAQLRPSDPAASPIYAVEGVAVGSNVKADGLPYREYKCGPSEQFDGFTWCQRSRRGSERQGSFEATYSILHSAAGTIVYANRTQQPAFLDASKADRDIQDYSRKLGGPPKVTKLPRRSGSSDAMVATWGAIELQPLDGESVKLLGEGKSPKRGFLIDFLGNFGHSAQEGLPIFRIAGGAGFLWAASFDQKGRGTLRIVAVDPSALQPLPAQASNTPQNGDRQGPTPQQPQRDDQPPPQNQVQPPSAKAGAGDATAARDTEATIARLQTELSAAVRAKAEADAARSEAEKAARRARVDVEIARKELEAATNEANAAKEQMEGLMKAGGRPVSYAREIIVIGLFLMVGILVFLIRTISRRQMAPAETADKESGGIDPTLQEGVIDGSAVAAPTANSSAARIDQEEIVRRLAETLGVQDQVPLSPAGSADMESLQPAVEWLEPSRQTGFDEAATARPEDHHDISKLAAAESEAAEKKNFDSVDKTRPPVQAESSTIPRSTPAAESTS